MSGININEIAREARLPAYTVMQVLFGKPDKLNPTHITRVWEIIQRNGLEQQLPVRVSQTKRLGVVVAGERKMDFAGHIVQGLSEAAQRYGFVIEYNFQNTDQAIAPSDFLKSVGEQGVVMIAAERTNEFVEACEQYRCPYVLVETEYRVISDKGVQITTNNHQAIVDVMHYLFSLGHQRIAYVAGYFRNQSMQERLEGYRSALHEAALAYVPDWVVETNWSHQQGYERARQLLSLDPRPTAVLCGNDLIAFGVMQAVQESGLPIGSGVSVVGFDDIEMASEVSPSLTTMRQPMRQMGEIAFTQLHKMLKGEAPDSRSIQLPAELIVRETTGPVKTN